MAIRGLCNKALMFSSCHKWAAIPLNAFGGMIKIVHPEYLTGLSRAAVIMAERTAKGSFGFGFRKNYLGKINFISDDLKGIECLCKILDECGRTDFYFSKRYSAAEIVRLFKYLNQNKEYIESIKEWDHFGDLSGSSSVSMLLERQYPKNDLEKWLKEIKRFCFNLIGSGFNLSRMCIARANIERSADSNEFRAWNNAFEEIFARYKNYEWSWQPAHGYRYFQKIGEQFCEESLLKIASKAKDSYDFVEKAQIVWKTIRKILDDFGYPHSLFSDIARIIDRTENWEEDLKRFAASYGA